ncbi:MAG TPA: M20 family metallopeptidase, partial [Vicinamibacterales bacterium]|nr:M20 family metallopeptidase [Vicinamibacterales bacterium]
ALVSHESPSDGRDALDACGAFLADRLAAAGASVTRLAAGSTTDHVLATWPGAGPRVLLVGHFDTVWPVGQLARMPLHESDGKLFGPGVLDMKGGLGIGTLAARAIAETVPDTERPQVSLIATSDEEVGSRTSRQAIERLARESAAVLVLEPALPGGAVKTARKGVGEFVVTAHGISAHAGANPGAGASAIHEIARQVTTIEGWSDPARGLTVNVGVIDGGLRSNVVAEQARAVVDVRVARMADAASIEAAFRSLAPVNPRVRIEVTGGINRPPMERTAGVARLYELAREVARSAGADLAEGATGGASDGNFTAALGIPTLDGLGATGDGPHALHEHVVINDLTERAALVAGILARLGAMR